MSQQEQNPQGDGLGMAGSVNLLYLGASGIAACFWPWLRRGMGPERPGAAGLAALVYMLIYAGATQAPEILWFLGLWLVMLILRRAETFRLIRAGVRLHSCDGGYPWLGMQMPWVKNVVGGLNAEVGLMLLCGAVLCPASEALGGFFLLGALGLAMVRGMDAQVTIMRIRRMRDAEIEQRYLSDLYRRRRDDY